MINLYYIAVLSLFNISLLDTINLSSLKVNLKHTDSYGYVSKENNIMDNGDADLTHLSLNKHRNRVLIKQNNSNGEITLSDGTIIDNTKVDFGKDLRIKLIPSKGFTHKGVRIYSHHPNDAKSLYGSSQYDYIVIPIEQFDDNNEVVIPAKYIHGNILMEGMFVEKKKYYPINFDANENHKNNLRSITGASINNQSAWVNEKEKMYNKSEDCFVAHPGETLLPNIGYNQSWMNAYVYLDKNRDGVFQVEKPKKAGVLDEDNEVVSFSGLEYAGGKYDSKGNAIKSLNTATLPSFTLPKDMSEGYYTMRFKIDWNDINPGGSTVKGNDIVKNSGSIFDIRLHVTKEKTGKAMVHAENGTLQYISGKGIKGTSPLQGATLPLGEELTILSTPNKHYHLTSVTVRHGKLDADKDILPIPEVAEKEITLQPNEGGLIHLPGTTIDGDIDITANFEQMTPEEEKKAFRYELVFDDEFNAPDGTRPNSKKWICSPRMNATWNRFISDSPEVAYIKDNALLCRAIPNKDKTSDKADMLTGAMQTSGKFAFTYGKVDVRLKTNLHSGNFPAAWMMPQKPKGGWPTCGEIDIFESINDSKTSFHTVHTNWTYNLGQKNNPKSSASVGTNVSQYHNYTLEWEKDYLKWFVDGKEALRYAKSNNSEHLKKGQWPFNYDFYIILNQSVGNGGWAAKPDLNYIYETYFDYIRVFKRISLIETGLEETTNTTTKTPHIYDLNGNKVLNPQKGIYIINGKKVIF